jgi:Skp family chaperone for outer membrane proteins
MTTKHNPLHSRLRSGAYGAIALCIAIAAPKIYAQARTFAVVDLRRAAAETNEGRNALTALKVQVDRRQLEIAPRVSKVEGMKRRLENPGRTPPATLQKIYQTYVTEVQQLQNLSERYTRELQEAEGNATNAILTKMQPVMRELAQSQSIQLIVDAQMVHYIPSHLNMTDQAIDLYNRRNPVALVDPDAGVGGGSRDGGGVAQQIASAGTSNAITPHNAPVFQADAGAPMSTGGTGLSPVFFRRDAGR